MTTRSLGRSTAEFILILASSSVSAGTQSCGSADLAAAHAGAWGVDLSGRDTTTNPGDDFFNYANGQWVMRTMIPSDKTTYGSFAALRELSERRVRVLLESAASAGPSETSEDKRKIGAFFSSFMNEPEIEQLGSSPAQPEIARVRAATSRKRLARLMGESAELFVGAVFSISIQPDSKDPSRYAMGLSQGGLGMPDRDYYLDATFAEKKELYRQYVARLLALAGFPEPDVQATNIVAFESRIAAASWSRTEARDPDKTYNPMSVSALSQFAPGFDWIDFLAGAGLPHLDRVIVAEKSAFPKIARIVGTTPVSTLQAWEIFQVVDTAAPYLSSPFVQARFEFRDKALSGQPELAPRWRRAVDAVQNGTGGDFSLGGMGEAVGRAYVECYFTPEARASMEGLVANLRTAFKHRIERVDWMSAPTKARALEKLSGFTIKIGYPDKWRDYRTLEIRADELYGNVERTKRYEWQRSLVRLNDPVDKSEWVLTPQTVNAYNGPLFNEVVFPAAILQPPFFDPKADPAVNYGAIGGGIGHEMTHGFDDQGRKYDLHGRLRNWWSDQDAARFEAEAAKLGRQYSDFEALPGAPVNGALTMGENIADLGGLNIALDAYHASLNGQPAPVIDGLTGDQRVFLGWAQVWRSKTRDDELRRRLVADVHAPAPARVNVPMRNIDTWYDAFAVGERSRSFLPAADRVHIW